MYIDLVEYNSIAYTLWMLGDQHLSSMYLPSLVQSWIEGQLQKDPFLVNYCGYIIGILKKSCISKSTFRFLLNTIDNEVELSTRALIDRI